MTRAAIYARFSTTMQREASIEDQVRICRERAALERCEVIEVFSDMAISGASTRRPVATKPPRARRERRR